MHGYLAPVIAYMTAVGMSRRPRWRSVLWIVLLLDAFSMLVTGYTTPFSIILTVLIGWTVAYGTLYAVGSPNVRPTGRTLMAGLRTVGFHPVGAAREEVVDTENGDRGRRYFVTLEDGPPLDVTVVDREQQAQGFFYRAWRNLTLRGFATRSSLQSLRQALEQEALLAYAAIAAGANAPKLIATSELGPDAVMLIYEHTGGRTLDSLADEEITDDLLRLTWHQVQALQSRRIAHRRLAGDAILVDRSGTVILTDLRGGEIAAGELLLRMDVAQLVTTIGLRVGAERAVASAVGVLGPDAVADCLPMLQPIALTRSTRATLRRLSRERAQRERDAILEASQQTRLARAEEASEGSTPVLEKPDKKAVRAEQRAEKRAIDEALDEAREEDLLTQIRHQVLLIRAAGARRTRPSGAGTAAHADQCHRGRDRRLLPADAAHAHRVRSARRQRPVGLGGRGRAVLGAELLRGGDGPPGVRAGAGAVPAGRGGAGRRVVREDRGPGRGRRCRPEHALPPAGRGAARARGGECRRVAAVRPRLPHPDAAVVRLSDRHREDAVAVAVQDGHRRSADGGGSCSCSW